MLGLMGVKKEDKIHHMGISKQTPRVYSPISVVEPSCKIVNSVEPQTSSRLSGYIFRRKQKSKLFTSHWVKRWYSLEGTKLRWYKDASRKDYRSYIDLNSIVHVSIFRGEAQHAFVLHLCEANRNNPQTCSPYQTLTQYQILPTGIKSVTSSVLLRCESKEEMSKWVKLLSMLIDKARGGSGTCFGVNDSNDEGKEYPTSLDDDIANETETETKAKTEHELLLPLSPIMIQGHNIKTVQLPIELINKSEIIHSCTDADHKNNGDESLTLSLNGMYQLYSPVETNKDSPNPRPHKQRRISFASDEENDEKRRGESEAEVERGREKERVLATNKNEAKERSIGVDQERQYIISEYSNVHGTKDGTHNYNPCNGDYRRKRISWSDPLCKDSSSHNSREGGNRDIDVKLHDSYLLSSYSRRRTDSLVLDELDCSLDSIGPCSHANIGSCTKACTGIIPPPSSPRSSFVSIDTVGESRIERMSANTATLVSELTYALSNLAPPPPAPIPVPDLDIQHQTSHPDVNDVDTVVKNINSNGINMPMTACFSPGGHQAWEFMRTAPIVILPSEAQICNHVFKLPGDIIDSTNHIDHESNMSSDLNSILSTSVDSVETNQCWSYVSSCGTSDSDSFRFPFVASPVTTENEYERNKTTESM
jgi:hypothetical protein